MTKVVPHTISNKFLVKFLQNLWEKRDLRAAGRLYVYIHRFLGSKYHRSKDETAILLRHFNSTKQIDRYLAVLVRNGYMRKNAKGHYFISKQTSIVKFPDYAEYYVAIGPDGKGYIAKKETKKQSLGVDDKPERRKRVRTCVPDEVVFSKHLWMDYLAGIYISSYATSIRHGKTRKAASTQAASNDPNGLVLLNGQYCISKTLVNSNLSQGCSNSVISKKSGCHISTASRWRSRGRRSGLYDTARYFRPVEAYWFKSDAPLWKNDVCTGIDPNRLVTIFGELYFECPTQIVMATDIFFAS